jgi:DNA-directed RNA polymerase specialized sigma24 family protein
MLTRLAPLPMPAASVSPREVQPNASLERHAAHLHGFALLMTLGDRDTAASLADQVLSAAAQDDSSAVDRPAAELRRRMLHRMRITRGRGSPTADASHREALEPLHVSSAAFAGLGALNPRERAAVVAAWIERYPREDLATILELDGDRLDTFVARATRRYLKAASSAPGDVGTPDARMHEPGPATNRVLAVRERLLAE